MANISQIKRVIHVLTQADISAFAFAVPVLWDSPFNGTNYIVGVTVEVRQKQLQTVDFSAATYYVYNITNLSGAGFDVGVGYYYAASVGDEIIVHAIGAHK